MKHRFIRIMSVLLCIVMLCTCLSFGALAITYNDTQSSNPDNYKVGDKIYYGNYPQTKVTDSALISTLTSLAGSTEQWISYGYYSGTGDEDDGLMTAKDYMKYTDVEYDNEKYRGVYFTEYRTSYTGYTSAESDLYQYDNGYNVNTIYFFKYEPLCWRVLDPSTGFCMCDYIIDSQAYNNYICCVMGDNNIEEWYGDSAHTHYTSDYANSSIRKWLNEDFYNTAFNETQKKNIKNTILINDSIVSSIFNSAQTTDKIFMLSYEEAYNSEYGFASEGTEDSYRRLAGTDYAWCQGLCTDSSYSYTSGVRGNNLYNRGTSGWFLRSPYDSASVHVVWSDGCVSDLGCDTPITCGGIVPAFKLSNLPSEVINKTENVKTTNAVSKKVVEKTTEDTNNNGAKILILSLGIAIPILFVMLIIIRKKIKKQ